MKTHSPLVRSDPSPDMRHIAHRCARLLSVALIGFALAQSTDVAAATLDETRTQYALVIEPPVIDGDVGLLNPDEWRFAAGNNDYWHIFPDTAGFAEDGIRGGELVSGSLPDSMEDLSYKVYVGFDEENLYVAVVVTDDFVVTDTAEPESRNGQTWLDDSVEVFVDGRNTNAEAWDASQAGGQFVITAANAYREEEAGNPGYGENAAWYAWTVFTDVGYSAEFRISLETLGNPQPGDVLGFTVVVNDDDDGGDAVQTQLSWKGRPHAPATYGNLVLGPATYRLVKVTTPPNPDGTINPNEYAGAQEIRVNAMLGVVYIPGADDDLPLSDLDYRAYAVHDEEAIYIAVDVTDEVVSTDQSDVEQMPDLPTWEDDSVEIFFDIDNSKAFGGGTTLAEGVFEGQYTQTHKGFYYDGSPSKDAQKGVHWFGTGSLTEDGYQVEFKIPKTSLGSPEDGSSMGFHIAVNDDDAVGDYSHIGWTGQAHHEYTYGTLVFSADGSTGGPGPGGDGPEIVSFTYTDGAFGMAVATVAGATYDIEYSQDLETWQVVMADVAGTGQNVPFTETDATRKAQPFGFYRVRVK